jgi:hypothetical protein
MLEIVLAYHGKSHFVTPPYGDNEHMQRKLTAPNQNETKENEKEKKKKEKKSNKHQTNFL